MPKKSDAIAAAGSIVGPSKKEAGTGLDGKRKIKELQDAVFPGRIKETQEICGKAIAYDVDWSSLADDLEALNFIDNISGHRLNMAPRVICQDDLGKEAVREGLKSVELGNVKDKAAKKHSFDGGVLPMPRAFAKGLDVAFSDNEIRELPISNL